MVQYNTYTRSKLTSSISWGTFISIILSFIALFLEYRYLFTLDYYISESQSLTDGYEWFEKEQSIVWLNVVGILGLVILRTACIALVLYISHKVTNLQVVFTQELAISSIATTIFSLNYLCSVAFKIIGLIPYTRDSINNNYRYQSLNVFFTDNIEIISVFKGGLDMLNITQMIFVIILFVTTWVFSSTETSKDKMKLSSASLLGYILFLFILFNLILLVNLIILYE